MPMKQNYVTHRQRSVMISLGCSSLRQIATAMLESGDRAIGNDWVVEFASNSEREVDSAPEQKTQ